jgi:NAD(P)H-dependent FMN reductase
MHIVAISGSLRANSSNTMLVRATAKLAPADMNITLYEGLDTLPHFSPDLDIDDAPPSVASFRHQLQDTDGILICTPEYAYGMPGVLKNALDWTVSSGEFVNKPVLTMSASPSAMGGEKAHASLLLTLSALSAHVVEEEMLTIPFIRKKLDASGNLTDPPTIQAITTVLQEFAQVIHEQHNNSEQE